MISKDIFYVGTDDKDIDLFEGQYPVPNGMSYNSYVISDQKIAVLDTVDARYVDTWLSRIEEVLGTRTPDYLIVQHMEPDHSSGIAAFTEKYPAAKIVSNALSFGMMQQFFHKDFSDRKLVVKDGDTLELGTHHLRFLTAPMVHWPEVTLTFDETDKVLFSADAFGKFGASDAKEEWDCEARRYYIGICGKYGSQVQALLKKARSLPIETICPLHGPVLRESIPHCVNLYDTWSSYRPENKGVCIAYTSVYGHTKEAVTLLAENLSADGCEKVSLFDLARCDTTEAVEDAFRYDKIVLATTTYNTDIFPFMRSFIEHLTERNFQNRAVAMIENGTWAPTAAKVMRDMLASCRDLTILSPVVTLRSSMTEANRSEIAALSAALMKI